MIVLRKDSRLGKAIVAKERPLVVGDPSAEPRSSEDEDGPTPVIPCPTVAPAARDRAVLQAAVRAKRGAA